MKITATLISFLFCLSLTAQDYSRIKIDLIGKDIRELAALGLDVEHAQFVKGRYLINDFSKEEMASIADAGFNYETLIHDLNEFYFNQNNTPSANLRTGGGCNNEGSFYNYELPDNYEHGGFGGFYTYEEMLAQLDEMASLYPDLISIKAPIDTFLTHEERPIYWIRISDNPSVDEDEPEALYTALHHAREPGGMIGIIFYMWYVLENYETNPEIQFLVDNSEMYFVPCVNPDGYIYNVDQYINGGSFYWRKNRRINGDGSIGVDLNRNYSYNWGLDDIGSSPDPGSATYRGPAPASEPETQAMQALCNAHEFSNALNYHTYGNYLLYPWAYGTEAADEVFVQIASVLNRENNFVAGTPLQTIGYGVNGSHDDWMYGDNGIYALAPELGPGQFGFYPPENAIDEICKSAYLQNLTMVQLLHSFGIVKETNENYLADLDSDFNFTLTRHGLAEGSLTVSLTGLSDNIDYTGDAKSFDLTANETVEDFISFGLNPGLEAGEELVFLLALDNGSVVHSDTVIKVYGVLEPVLVDNGDNLDLWDTNVDPTHMWETTTEAYYSESSSITDSPNGVYNSFQQNYLEMEDPIAIPDSVQTILSFWAKWDTENDYDYAQLSMSTNGFSWTPLCGKYTNTGTGDQDPGQPLYDGLQADWVKEEIDLSEYAGQAIYLRFSMISDGFINGDGFYFDELIISSLTPGEVTSSYTLGAADFKIKTTPNPAKDYTMIEFSDNIPNGRLLIYDALGNLVEERNIRNVQEVKLNVSAWSPGIYFCEVHDGTGVLALKRLVVIK